MAEVTAFRVMSSVCWKLALLLFSAKCRVCPGWFNHLSSPSHSPRLCVLVVLDAGRGHPTRGFSTISEHTWQAFGVVGIGRVLGLVPHPSRPGRLDAAGEVGEQFCLGAGRGEGDAHAGRRLDDARSDLEQPRPQGGELGAGQRLRSGDGITELQRKRSFAALVLGA